MMIRIPHWLTAALCFVLPLCASGQADDPVADLADARRIYVPVEDLDVIIERDKQGVLLPRAKFDVLLTQAKANAEKNAVPAGVPVVMTAADYAARIVGDQLLIQVTAELTQFDHEWRETRFALQRLSLEQARLDDAPALVGRHPDGSVSLFTDSRGSHTVTLQLSTELTALGSDQVAAFSLLGAPSGSFTLSLPAGKRLLIGNLQLERPASLDQVADYKIAVGGSHGLQLRITDRAAENAADSLTFATTGYGLHVAPGEVTWHALTTLQVFGKPVDRLTFSVPSQLEIADVGATGLESWNLSDDPNEAGRTVITLTFGQAFDGARKITMKGVMAVETGKPWSVPPLRIASVTSHIGQIVVQYPAGVRLRVEETASVRRATEEQKPTADMPDDMPKMNASEYLRFDFWQPDFTLRLITQPKGREVQAAVAAVLDVNATGLELQVALTVETHFAPLFEVDVRLPSEWQVISAQSGDQPLKWQIAGLDEAGVNQLRIQLNPVLPKDGTGQIRLAVRRDVEGWPVESEAITVNLPELFLPQSSLTEGALVVRGDNDLDLEAFDLTGLDPQPLKADFERLRFQSQDTRYSGKLKITRKPSRVSAQTVTVARIDPQNFHVFLQAEVEIQGGGVRSVKVALPETTGTALQFECPSPRIVEQKSAPAANGERVWTLQFDQRLRGQTLIGCDIEMPRDGQKEFVAPQCRFIDAERQTGFFAVEAGAEQRLTVVAKSADGAVLSEIDPLDLPAVYYQPKERLVAVYRAAAAGTVLTLSEQKFEKLPVPTAICPLLEVSTIVGQTGELQHRATFHLNVVGVQGLHVTFPAGTTLWATLIDGRPVEVRRSRDVYLIPLAASNVPTAPSPPGGTRIAQFFYRSEVPALTQFGVLKQEAPSLTVESGQRTALNIEVLKRIWDVHYPEETRLVGNHGPMEPDQPLDRISVLGNWNASFRIRTPTDFAWQLAAVLAAIVIVALLGYGHRRNRLIITQVVVLFLVFAILVSLMLPAVQQSRRAARRAAPAIMGGTSESYSADETVGLKSPTDESAKARGTRYPESLTRNETSLNRILQSEPSKEKESSLGIAPPAKKMMPPGPGPGIVPPVNLNGVPEQPVAPKFDLNNPNAPAAAENDRVVAQEMLGAFDDDAPVPQGNNAIKRPPSLQGLLSLAIEFVPPAGTREKTFHYVGADSSPNDVALDVDYVDRHSGAAFRVFVMALVAMTGWLLRKGCGRSKIAMATIGIVTSLALFPLVPVTWQVVLDGVFLGTLVAVVLWIIRNGVIGFHGCCSVSARAKTAHLIVAIATVLSLAENVHANEKPAESQAKPIAESSPGTTLVIPFDVGTEPLASERVFLSHDQFLQLYRLANPDQVTRQPAPQAGGVLEALYVAKLVANVGRPEESTVHVTARFAVRSFVDGQLLVELPVGQVSAREARLDGQTAALMAHNAGFRVAVPKPGLHVIDFEFDVSARLSGTTGSFTLPLTPVPAGKLTFELPGRDLSIRVNGSSTIYRRVTEDNAQFLEFPVDKGGEFNIAWQPTQAIGAAAALVQVDSVEAITLTDAGVAVSQGFSYRVRQGGVADTSFLLPDNLRLQAVSGPDVGGWELQGDGAARKLRVIFRRNVTDQTRLTVETFLDIKVGTASTTIPVPQIAPQEITNEIGQVAIFAGSQFTIRAEQAESLSQIDSDKFATQIPVSHPHVAPQLAYRFSKRPFSLLLRAARQESQSHVTAQQAAFITLRKQQLTTRLRFNLTGAPRSSLSVALPQDFVLLDVQATNLRDWYVSKHQDGSILTVELTSLRLGLTEIVVGGFVVREDARATITFPQPVDVTRVESHSAIWLDEGFTGTLDSFDDWRSVDASHVNQELRAVRPEQQVQFAFASTSTRPGPISLTLNQAMPRLSANGLSMVTVTDVAVIYTLALQWQIESAKTDTLVLTTPDWLAGKLDFQGTGLREATYADAEAGRTRWTIHLRTPVSGKYFATATATLPPPAKEVLAPSVVFERDQKAIEPQQQYVLLINSSLNQLTSVDTSLIESVQREDVPVVVQQEFVDQATELVRVKSLLTAPRWSLHSFAQTQGAPASVNIADLTTILSRDGTFRGVAIYTIKNRSRQFLTLQMPENSELLSVFVGGMPSRAVTAKLPSLKGSSAQLIALPKTSAASLSFPVKIVWRGSLSGTLPKSARLLREEFAVPSPRILSQQDDPDYGIPVARTRWTVYVPDDLDVIPVRSSARFNLSPSDDSDSPYGNAALQEAGELLGFLEQSIQSNRRMQTVNNLKQIGAAAQSVKQLGDAIKNLNGKNGSEFAKNKADVLKRMSDLERQAQLENQKTNEYFAKSMQAKPGLSSVTMPSNILAEGEALAEEQRRSLSDANGADGIRLHDESSIMNEFNFQLEVKDAETSAKSESKDGKSKIVNGNPTNPTNETRQQLQRFNQDNIDSLNSVVTSNTISRNAGQQGNLGMGFGASNQTLSANGSNNFGNGVSNFNAFITGANGPVQGNGVWNDQSAIPNQQVPLIPGMDNNSQFSGQVFIGGGSSAGEGLGGFRNGQFGGQGGFGGGQFGGQGGFGGGQFGGQGGFGGGQFGGRGRAAGQGGIGVGGAQVGRGEPNSRPQSPQAASAGPASSKSAAPAGNANEQTPFEDTDTVARFNMNGMMAQAGRGIEAGRRPGGPQMATNAGPVWNQAGGLSIDVELPISGRKLVFTKVGGDPKLALAVRPQESMRWGISLIWSAVWIVLGATVLATLRHETAVRRLTRRLPMVAAIFGVLGFCVLPGSLSICSFVVFVFAALIVAFRKQPSSATV